MEEKDPDDDLNERSDDTKPPVAWGLITHLEWLLTRWRKRREENGGAPRREHPSASVAPFSVPSKNETTPQIGEKDEA